MTYTFDIDYYNNVKKYPHEIDWNYFTKNRKCLGDYHNLANPIVRGSVDHLYWKEFFDKLFKKSCTFPFIIRLINSYLIIEQAYDHY